ncbi:hypothetical protein CSAL01_13143, partial [Colletotrichum salicis]
MRLPLRSATSTPLTRTRLRSVMSTLSTSMRPLP